MSPPERASPSGALPPAAIALMLLLAAVWGLNMVAVKVTSAGIPPVLQAGLRSVLAALLVPLLCRPLGLGFGDWRHGGALAAGLCAGAIFAVEFIALYIGIGLTTASRAVVFLYGAPFWVALGTHFLVPGDQLTRAKAVGLCVAFGGLVLAFADGLRAPAGPDALLGDLLCLLGGVLWAATTVLVKASALRAAPPALVLQYQLVVSAPLLLLRLPAARRILGDPTLTAGARCLPLPGCRYRRRKLSDLVLAGVAPFRLAARRLQRADAGFRRPGRRAAAGRDAGRRFPGGGGAGRPRPLAGEPAGPLRRHRCRGGTAAWVCIWADQYRFPAQLSIKHSRKVEPAAAGLACISLALFGARAPTGGGQARAAKARRGQGLMRNDSRMTTTSPSFTRRAALAGFGASLAAPMIQPAFGQGAPIKVGVLHSLSGTMAISETALRDTVLMMVE